jgi:hypothetical protein
LLSNEQNAKWIEVYVEISTAVASKGVDDTETVTKQEQEHMLNAENMGLTTREPQKTI